jgi:hypothetical protein
LLTLYRYRNQVQCLDTASALTRGNPVGAWAVLDSLRLEYGSYARILKQDGNLPTMIGQMRYTPGERAARLAYLTPETGLDSPGLTALIESLAWEAGNQGACTLLAEVDETSPTIESLRRAGFGVYAWQRIWKLNEPLIGANGSDLWENATDFDALPIRALYQALVPPLVQSAESLAERPLYGQVYEQSGELLAYFEVTYGPRGIYLQPLIHPAVNDVLQLVRSFLSTLSFQLGRPVYLSIRSYQAWLENALSELDAEYGPRQALMVKHLMVKQTSPAYAVARNSAVEGHQPAMITRPGSVPFLWLPPASEIEQKIPYQQENLATGAFHR